MLPEEERCVQKLKAYHQEDMDKLLGSVITCADANDILEPKVSLSIYLTKLAN
jgi:hypothetical protein